VLEPDDWRQTNIGGNKMRAFIGCAGCVIMAIVAVYYSIAPFGITAIWN